LVEGVNSRKSELVAKSYVQDLVPDTGVSMNDVIVEAGVQVFGGVQHILRGGLGKLNNLLIHCLLFASYKTCQALHTSR
jgi:hypothetical protein